MADIRTVQRVPSPDPTGAYINTAPQGDPDTPDTPHLDRLQAFASTNGDISDLLTPAQLDELGIKAMREWRLDEGSRESWKEKAERSLDIAAQERPEEDEREPLWNDEGANIHYPILTVSAQQFAARAYPELVKGDKVVGIRTFQASPNPQAPPQAPQGPPPQPGQPPSPQMQAAAQQAQAMQAQEAARQQAADAKAARAQRVATYLNFLIFYKMDDWEGETDQLLHELPIVGSAFKKVMFGTTGLRSDYVSALRLSVHNGTKSLYRVPRITQDFEVYPYEVEDRIRDGTYRADAMEYLPPRSESDEQKPYEFIEQHRLDDLDGDGLAEPYIVTVEQSTQTVVRVEPAYTMDDVFIRGDRVSRIDRWLPFSEFAFLPDLKGRFYKLGFGQLLEDISETVDSFINQMIDAGTAQIAGGGFISSGVRLQGSGQGGVVTFQPGEFAVADVPAGQLQQSIWERTVPQPSDVAFKMLELLLAAAKDIAAVKDVITGEAPSTAPVGTTLALQNQALQVFSSIYKRVYRGFRDEFRLMFRALKRWATDKERQEYTEITGGDLDQDFAGDGTDIQPVADPTVVTKMQKMARNQAVMMLAESEVGKAAGMLTSGPAQKIVTDMLDDMDYPVPTDYVGPLPPDPEVVAKAQDMAASAQLKGAQAEALPQKMQIEAAKVHLDAAKAVAEDEDRKADVGLIQAKTLRELGLASIDTHELHKEADRISQTGSVADAESLVDPAEEAEKDRAAAKAKPKGGAE